MSSDGYGDPEQETTNKPNQASKTLDQLDRKEDQSYQNIEDEIREANKKQEQKRLQYDPILGYSKIVEEVNESGSDSMLKKSNYSVKNSIVLVSKLSSHSNKQQ